MKIKILAILLLSSVMLQAQQKQPIDDAVYDSWKSFRNGQIANDGQHIIYTETPLKGDATLKIYQTNSKKEISSINRVASPTLLYDSKYVVFKLKHATDSVRLLKFKKTSKKKMPKDTLAVYSLTNNQLSKIPFIKSYKTPEKAGKWLAYQVEDIPKSKKKKAKKDDKKSDKKSEDKSKEKSTTEKPKETKKAKKKPKKKVKKQGKKTGYHLIVRNLENTQEDTFKFVLSYSFDEKGTQLAFATTGKDSTFEAGVYTYNLKTKKLTPLLLTEGKVKNLKWDEAGEQLAFVADIDTSKAHKKALQHYFSLYYWNTKKAEATVIADTNQTKKNWLISEYARLSFSKNGERLFFGVAPKPLEKDTLTLAEEKVKVDIWSWTDGQLQPQQLVNAKREKNRSYRTVYHTKTGKIVSLASPQIPSAEVGNEGQAEYALGISNEPYKQLVSWEGYPYYYDLYLINVETGRKKLLKSKIRGYASMSPNAKYVYWYERTDSSWMSYNIKTQQLHNLTANVNSIFYNEENDKPDYPREYGITGWTKDDKQILINDRYDIWSFDPNNKKPAKRLTNGRSQKIGFEYVRLDREKRFIEPKETLLLEAFNEENFQAGFYHFSLKDKAPKRLLMDDYMYRSVNKAKDANVVVFSKMDFQTYPDRWVTDFNFKNPVKISNVNPQQEKYLWGTVERTSWYSLEGQKLEGLIYKPENFDPKKKYPMMVYFYEKYAERLHQYYSPRPSRSIINFTRYVSNGYVVFIPDIVYKDGFPGQSAYNCVIPGVMSMIDKGYINKDKIGVQGHSWGGYQAAYLVTKTNLFRAAEAGAPVSNMTSAYGGIRWASGLSRMFQYEHTQSRIGGTLWEKPMHYLENSPIFSANTIQTPLLILHNDKDGAVPWYQGIELFVALRRLGRPTWLLNYNGEKHGIRKLHNQKDFTKRMNQYFDHYLLDKPAPEWMIKGVPAIEKGLNDGFELIKPLKDGQK